MKRTVTAIAMTLMMVLASGEANALAKKRSAYTKEQQKAIFADALKRCRKQFGAQLHEVKVDYGRNQYICYHY
jgi:recombination DNA repair RAD52 pathway protein